MTTSPSSNVKIVLVNGPPRSGKDTVGAIIVKESPRIVRCCKFATELKDRVHAAYRLFDKRTRKPIVTEALESVKDHPQPFFLGKTPREIYIAFSEVFMKPLHGKDIFGRLLLGRLQYELECEGGLPPEKRTEVIVITDSGFRKEVEMLSAHFGVHNCRLIQVHRHGCDFSGDSRGYLDVSDIGMEVHEVVNPEGDLSGLLTNLRPAIGDLLLGIVK